MRITFDFVPEGQCETERTLIQYQPNGDTVVVVNEDWYGSLSHDQKKVVLLTNTNHARTFHRVRHAKREANQLALRFVEEKKHFFARSLDECEELSGPVIPEEGNDD